MNVRVVTRNLSNPDEPPHTVVIDDEQKNHRIWLSKHAFWAMRTNRSVTSYATDDAVTYIDKTRAQENAA